MRQGFAFWLVCCSLVFTRLVGLHLHACAGVETGSNHATTHYADNGLLFGEHHSEDDGDDREIELFAVVASKIESDVVDLIALPSTSPILTITATRLLTHVSPRGPPAAWPAHPPHFTPPPQGPPTSLV